MPRSVARPVAGPLAGLRVIDCSTVLAGPYCTMLLADLGADVIKVEPLEGDATRGWGPPWVGNARDGSRTAAYYLAVNRTKRSLRLDLHASEGAAVLRRLLADADVLVENFRPGALGRLGFGEAVLAELNPKLVHLAISGYGPSGPDADRPGYDFVLQAEGGLMSVTGQSDEDGGRPTKVGVAIADLVTGLQGAVAILAAVAGRERPDSPAHDTGQRIDVSLLGSTLAILVNQAQNTFVTGASPGRRGNAHPNIVPYETFDTADGEVAVAIGSERQWPRFCEALGLGELAVDPRFATNENRVDERIALRSILAERFLTKSSADWLARFKAADVPASPINDIASAFAMPQAQALGMKLKVTHPGYGRTFQVGPAFALSVTPTMAPTAPPLLGEQSDKILAEIGYTAAEIKGLRRAGVV
jgi:crotonobetainyl-CoA:carnitine CoA-transferase CaiB-like acyl-CoA transferase